MNCSCWKIDRLIELLGYEVIRCPSEDCCDGIDITSYGDRFPCNECGGVGEIIVKQDEE